MLDISELYKILFVPTITETIIYYRMENFMKVMQKDNKSTIAMYYDKERDAGGCKWEYNIKDPNVMAELGGLFEQADLAVFQGLHTREGVAFMCAVKEKFKIPILAEFDDDPYSLAGSHPYYDKIAPGSECELWSDDQIKLSDGIITTTNYLADIFRKNNKNVWVIPNSFDFEMWDSLKKPRKKKDGLIYIGWAGGANHYDDLELIEEPLKYILNKYKNVRFIMSIGHEIKEPFKSMKGVKAYDMDHWRDIHDYPQWLKSLNFDIGLAPLRDRQFNRAKSNLKWLEYSALRIPTIASPVEPYNDTTALMAKGKAEWIEKMELLIHNEELRKQLGESSYNIAKEKYNVKDVGEKYLKLCKNLIDKNEVKNA